ncbi:hypothetical protein ISE23_28035 [Pseudomonas aeruginosa]|nr:hypothetical protein [Pseudomonas aeruginosa]MBX5562593.1 hypothetical protein [Pseudomonas aeruginosa]MBX5639477.1 hypothetical protein [Pseudomonas aeruginosa]MBX5878254.1 hypothetical protein [Pseudomonas aeruginosa]MBX5926415.1 hypothetical protein [Pseudomonas aeruginosa]
MSSTQHQLIEQCAIRLRGIVEALDNIHDSTQHRSPHRWSTDLDDVHSSAESLLALINDQAPAIDAQGLAQPSPAQAEQHWPKLEKPAQVGAIRFHAGLSSRLVVEAAQRLYEFESTPEQEAERIERLQAFREQCFEPLGTEFSKVLSENLVELSSDAKPEQADEKPGDSILCYGCFAKGVGPDHFDEAGKCLAAQAEAERPEVVGYRSNESGMVYEQDYGLKNPEALTTVAECERIVGALRAVITQLRQHKNDYMDAGQETYRALQNEIREREAEIARLDGLVSGRTAERDAALANVDALAVQVLKLGGTISFAHHRTNQAGQVPQAWLDVQAERRRQITAEGWTPEHDDEHADGQMAQAAGCYALHAGGIGTDWPDGRQNGAALFWPWDKDSWKPTTPRRDLVKACALALAEIERLDRATATQGGPRDA